jgi:hypothetical protein
MIKLTKALAPPELIAKLEGYKQRLLALLAAGEEIPASLKDAYRNDAVKELVKRETNEKCLYCESKIGHVYYGDVEHILPKSVFPDLTFDLTNLSYACSICNNKKKDYHDPDLFLINPFIDDPYVEFIALGPLIKGKPGRDRATLTELRLELNRPELFERRKERIERLHNLAGTYMKAPSDTMRALLEDQLRQEATDDCEYTFVVRDYLARACNIVICR